MYATLFDPPARHAIVERVGRLTPQNERRWGRLTLDRAVAHMADQLRMALGEIPASPPRGPLRFAPTRFLAIHVLPWPRGRVKGPGDAFKTSPSELEADRGALLGLIERVGTRDPRGEWPSHALFGTLSGADWGVLCHRHLDHHLTQFSA
jgi:hypothetical protein